MPWRYGMCKFVDPKETYFGIVEIFYDEESPYDNFLFTIEPISTYGEDENTVKEQLADMIKDCNDYNKIIEYDIQTKESHIDGKLINTSFKLNEDDLQEF